MSLLGLIKKTEEQNSDDKLSLASERKPGY